MSDEQRKFTRKEARENNLNLANYVHACMRDNYAQSGKSDIFFCLTGIMRDDLPTDGGQHHDVDTTLSFVGSPNIFTQLLTQAMKDDEVLLRCVKAALANAEESVIGPVLSHIMQLASLKIDNEKQADGKAPRPDHN